MLGVREEPGKGQEASGATRKDTLRKKDGEDKGKNRTSDKRQLMSYSKGNNDCT